MADEYTNGRKQHGRPTRFLPGAEVHWVMIAEDHNLVELVSAGLAITAGATCVLCCNQPRIASINRGNGQSPQECWGRILSRAVYAMHVPKAD